MNKVKTLMTAACGIALVIGMAAASASDASKTKQAVKGKVIGVQAGKSGVELDVHAMEEKIKADLQKKYPSTKIQSVTKAPIGEDLYEVIAGRNVAFVDSKTDLFLFGHLFDMKTQQDMTQAHLDEVTRIDFAKLPLDKAIKVVKGNGSRVFAVFSDPDCPYCHALEMNLNAVDNYTMYVFMYPLEELHPNARARANEIWCAEKPAEAWHTYLNSQPNTPSQMKSPKEGCAAPIDEIARLGASLGVQGTPMLINKNGIRLPGAAQQAQLEDFLNAAQGSQPRAVSTTGK